MMKTADSGPLKVTFTEPAKHWTDAISRFPKIIFASFIQFAGQNHLTIFDLNLFFFFFVEDTLWTGTPGVYTDPRAPEALSEVRKLVDREEYSKATESAAKLTGNPAEVYQLLGDIKLEFDYSHLTYGEETYLRELDLDTATAKVNYSVGDVEFERENFASYPNQVIVTKISGSKPGKLSFTVSLDSKLFHQTYINGKNQIIMEGRCPSKRIPPEHFAKDSELGIKFSAILDLKISDGNGVISILYGNNLKVEAADWAVLLLVASSSFSGPFTQPSDSRKEPTSECLSTLKSISNLSYADLYANHLTDYQELFHRVSLHLLKSTQDISRDGSLEIKRLAPSIVDLSLKDCAVAVSTSERVKAFQTEEDPLLVELLFQYGRYLLISCSRPGSEVANLQGIWNKDLQPAWEGAPHLNINLEMNYWPSLPCNLSECQEPLFDHISFLSLNGRETARVNYQANGWVVHHMSDIWAKSSASDGEVVWAVWPMGGAWLCTHLWEHYAYTLDEDFLRHKAYPLLEGCVSFLLSWLIEGNEGFLETNPSTSPEHSFIAPNGEPACVSRLSTMDIAIIQEVFSIFLSAAEILGRGKDDIVEEVRKGQPRLRPTKIATDGCIMEWEKDFEDQDEHHRHLSHLFGLFPGHTITSEKSPALFEAAEKSLYKRGEEGPGWSTTWKAACWARLRNSSNAYKMIKHLFRLVDPNKGISFEGGGLYSNLFAAHPPFQIDANFGFTAAIAEMLVQSTLEDLYLLPALPQEKWPNGSVEGLKARGGTTVSIWWREGNLEEVAVWSNHHTTLQTIHYREATVTASFLPGVLYNFNGKLKCLN